MPRVTYVSHTCHIRVTVRDGGPGSSERSSFASSFITTSMSVTDLTIRIGSIRRRPHGLTISASTQAATTWKILDISTPNMHHTPPQRMLIGCHTVILCHIMSYYVILHAMRGWYWFTDPFTECCFHMYMYIYMHKWYKRLPGSWKMVEAICRTCWLFLHTSNHCKQNKIGAKSLKKYTKSHKQIIKSSKKVIHFGNSPISPWNSPMILCKSLCHMCHAPPGSKVAPRASGRCSTPTATGSKKMQSSCKIVGKSANDGKMMGKW